LKNSDRDLILLKDCVLQYSEIEFHQYIANNQRKKFNQQCLDIDLLDKSIIILMDYKANIILGFLFQLSFFFLQINYIPRLRT